MNFSDADRLELSALCGALADGTLDAGQRKRLAEMLATSEEARRFYVRAMSLSASLHEYAGELQSDAPDLPPAHERPAWTRWTAGALAAAAAVALAFWLGGLGKSDGGGDALASEKDSDESVAQISGAKNCEWRGTAFQPGDDLPRGQRIELVRGFAEITFDSGAQITVEGPATLVLNSEWEAALERGTLKAVVPAEAIGFRIANPAVAAVDPGTEFSMVAYPSGARELFVTKGAIEVQSREEAEHEQPGLMLHENQARRFAGSDASEVRDRDQKLARLSRKTKLDRLVQPANYVHWTFDELNRATIPGTVLGAGAGDYSARLQKTGGADFADLRTPGRFLGALRFDGTVFATAPFAGLSKNAARTVALWVKVPQDAPLSEMASMLSWASVAGGGGMLIGWNRNPDFGALGALRTKAGRGVFAGTTPLRDGRWHHVAVALSPGSKPDAMKVRQYVDGRLEAVSAKHFAKRTAARANPAAKVPVPDLLSIGRGTNGVRFRGEMDELFIADRVLAPQEIRHLMLRNQPMRAEPLAAN